MGVVGPIASGKGIVSDFLVEKGFVKYSFSDEVRAEAQNRNIPIERKYLQDLGNKMRSLHGNGYWAQRIIKKLEENRNYVIEGIRNPGEIDILRKLKDFILIGIDTPLEIRLERILKRNKDSDPKTREEIEKIEARDRGEGEKDHGQQVDVCYKMADYFLTNEGSIEDIRLKVELLLKKLDSQIA